MNKERNENQPKTNYDANTLHMQSAGVKNVANRQDSTKNDKR